MKYKLKDHVTSQMLQELGFTQNVWNKEGKTFPIETDDFGRFECSRESKIKNVSVSISKLTNDEQGFDTTQGFNTTIEVYAFEGIETAHKKLFEIRGQTPYIRDLIRLGYVEKLKGESK
jgi:hypothetical protein